MKNEMDKLNEENTTIRSELSQSNDAYEMRVKAYEQLESKLRVMKDVNEELREEIKRLHDKYDLQLLVKRCDRYKAALEFASEHLKGMENYSLVYGALYEIRQALITPNRDNNQNLVDMDQKLGDKND